MNLEQLIQVIALYQASASNKTQQFANVELWDKFQKSLVASFYLRSGKYDDQLGASARLIDKSSLDKEKIMLLTNTFVAHQSGMLNDSFAMNCLLASVKQLIEDKTVSSAERTFNLSEVSMLVDAIYKSKPQLDQSYGDILLEHLEH